MNKSIQSIKILILIITLLNLGLVRSAHADTTLQSEIARFINEGINYHNNRNYILAIRSFHQAYALDPSNKQIAENLSIAHNNYGKYLAERTDGQGAAREFRNALYYDVDNSVARSNLEYKLKEQEIPLDDYVKRIVEAKQERMSENFMAAIAELREANKIKETVEAHTEIGVCYHLLSIKTRENNTFNQNALDAFSQAHTLNPDNPRPLIKLGDVNIATGKINRGIDYYEQAIKLDPDNEDAQSALINGWLAALRIAPHLANNHVGLATAYQLKGDFEQAERSYRRALQIEPTNKLAINGLGNLRQDQVKTQVNLFLDRALQAQRKKQYDVSLTNYIKALNLEPSNPDIHYNIGTAFQAKGDLLRAKKAYTRTLELNPNHKEASSALIILKGSQKEHNIADAFAQAIKFQEDGEYEKAIKIYNNISKDKPSDDTLFYNLAVAYQAVKNYDKSVENYERAYAINPDSNYSAAIESLKVSRANEILTYAIEQQGRADNQNAIENYKKVIAIVPTNANAWYNLGTAYQAVGKDADALDSYRKAYEIDPKGQSEAMFFAALILEEGRKLIAAIDLYDKYIQTAPNGDYVAEAKERKEYIKSFL
jgi:tetratricopeptide (TPR) repeat protein